MISGYFARKRSRRGINQWHSKTAPLPASAPCFLGHLHEPGSICDMVQRLAYLYGIEPRLSLICTPRPFRIKQLNAHHLPSTLICWLIAEWVTWSSFRRLRHAAKTGDGLKLRKLAIGGKSDMKSPEPNTT